MSQINRTLIGLSYAPTSQIKIGNNIPQLIYNIFFYAKEEKY